MPTTARVAASSGLSGKFNYVRNSVKVVINAYTGSMNFFVIDPTDPIIQVYEGLPRSVHEGPLADKMIPGITAHFRYPEDLFRVQTNMYGRYHLTQTTAFYTQANAWNISQDPGSGRPGTGNQVSVQNPNGTITFSTRQLDPSYEVAALPGQTEQKFLIVQPFVPLSPQSSRQNLTAVMFASADPGDYGQLTLYETPPGETVDGPELVQSIIANTPTISNELTLLNQQGSEVELGEVVTVPISNTLLYVQPVYVQSSTNPIPVLRDVIVVYNGVAYHSQNASLDGALCQIANGAERPFAQYCTTAPASRPKTPVSQTNPTGATTTTTTTVAPPTTAPASTPTTPGGSQTLAQLLTDAQKAYAAPPRPQGRQPGRLPERHRPGPGGRRPGRRPGETLNVADHHTPTATTAAPSRTTTTTAGG